MVSTFLRTIFCASSLAMYMIVFSAGTDGAPSVEGRLMTKLPVIDGNFSPEEWGEASKVSDMKDIITTQLPKDPTDIYLGYSKEGIYVAYYSKDSEPQKLVGREIIPNANFNGEDQVFFAINPFGNRSFDNMSVFNVNLLGTKTERISGGRSSKREWRGEWQAKTSKVADGWVCEMFIPWKMLNYPEKSKLDMDVEFARLQGRTLFVQRWGNVRQNELPENLGIWRGVEPPKPPKPRPQFLAYSTPEIQNGKVQVRNGLDARYAFTPSVTGIASFSPDFKNIEDVVAGIDFVRTERFLGETRPFFNEGNDFFNLTEGFSYGTMFYSRRIGPFDAGAKVFGQYTKNLGVGALFTSNFDGESAAVVNVNQRKSATENFSMFATQHNAKESNNSVGFEYSRRRGMWGVSMGSSMEKSEGRKADTAGHLSLNYQGKNSFGIARYYWVTPEFNPTLAFIPWTNRRGGYVFAETNKEIRKGPIRSYGYGGDFTEFKTYEGELQEGGFSSYFSLQTRKDASLSLRKQRYTYSGSLDDTQSVDLDFNVSNRFKQYGLGYSWGTQNDKPSKFFSLNAQYRLFKNFDASIRQSIQELDGTARQTVASLAYQLSAVDLVSSRMVWNGSDSNIYFSYRHTGGTGTDLYFIYGDPNAPRSTNRIAIKAVWAF